MKLFKFDNQRSHYLVVSAFLFATWLLSFLVCFSLPKHKAFYLWELSASVKDGVLIAKATVTGDLKFGLWGTCWDLNEKEGLGLRDINIANQHESGCLKGPPGIHIPSNPITKLLHIDKLESDFNKTFHAIVVFHVFVCVSSFIALLIMLASFFTLAPVASGRLRFLTKIKIKKVPVLRYPVYPIHRQKPFSYILLFCLIWATFWSFIATIIDFVVAKVAGAAINKLTGGILHFSHGPIAIMILCCFILSFILCVLVVPAITAAILNDIRGFRRAKPSTSNPTQEMSQVEAGEPKNDVVPRNSRESQFSVSEDSPTLGTSGYPEKSEEFTNISLQSADERVGPRYLRA